MSYWIYLNDPETGNAVEVERHAEGGTFALGGTCRAELNVTYNYSSIFHRAEFSVRDLDGKTARETISTLERVVDQLGVERDRDYWAATDGNAGFAAGILLAWARQHPDAIWRVS